MDENNNNFEQAVVDESNNMLEFVRPIGQSSIIKVIGVGGGGCNAVNHMCRQGIAGVDFIVCNTDIKALNASSVENRIVLGNLGAGSKTERAKEAAEKHSDEIREMLSNNTKMLFITAGMGGGTGTGAAPVIAQIAKSIELDDDPKNILVVAVVTTPFSWEGPSRLRQAESGIAELRKTVDSMIVVNNDKIRSLGGNLSLTAGFAQANNVLLEAVKGISDIITGYGIINRDFQDVNTVMEHSGRALMGSGLAAGEDRAKEAVVAASNSSLLNDSDISGAQNILLYFYFSPEHEITNDEMYEVTSYLSSVSQNDDLNIIFGAGYDESLDDELRIILVATGLETGSTKPVEVEQSAKIDNVTPQQLEPKKPETPIAEVEKAQPEKKKEGRVFVLDFEDGTNQVKQPAPTVDYQKSESKPSNPVAGIDTPVLKTEPFLKEPQKSPSFQTPVAQGTMSQTASASAPVYIDAPVAPEQYNPQREIKTVDVSLIQDRADRVKHIYDLLHNCSDGPQQVEALTTEQLSGEALFETTPSSVSDVARTKVTPDGRIEENNPFLYTFAD